MIKIRKSQIDLERLSEEEFLDLRICELPLQIEGTWLKACVEELYNELEAKGITFKPECYLADEWLTPEGETCIGIPFYLAHPTLIHLEKKFMAEAEGETTQWCMKLLRHEAGHAICYAYGLNRRKKWEKIFGASTIEYKDIYKYQPYSKSYVQHLEGHYAQYHPDEDFVETFAVWLTPNFDWKQRYRGWGALRKLNYIDQLMSEIKGKKAWVKSSQKFYRLSTLRMTLKNHYRKKRHFWAEEFPDFHDQFLTKQFHESNGSNKSQAKAYELIKRYRREILNNASQYSGERKYIVKDILRGLQKRSRQLKLVASPDESTNVLSLSSYVTSLCMNYRYTGRYRGEKKRNT